MLKVIGYQHSAKLPPRLEAEIGSKSAVIVTANPLKADSLRLQWARNELVDVVTFSKFSSTLAKKINPNEEKLAWRKSKLLIQLNAFKNLLPQGKNLSYSEFKAAYQIFSDLRAYVPSQDFPDEILAHFDENISLVAQLFHQASRSLDILDEHTGTLYLAEELRKPEAMSLETETIIFEGFSFLTPVQMSLVEALSIRHKVLIPIPQRVLDQAHPFDWVSIIKDSCDELLSDDTLPEARTLSLQLYPSGALLSTLKNKFETNDQPVQIVLSCKSLDPIIEQGLPIEGFQKKMALDVLAEEREKVFAQLESVCVPKYQSALEIVKIVDEMIAVHKKNPTLDAAKSIAVLQLIKKACLIIAHALDHQRMDNFFFHLLKEVVSLDSPRNSLISMSLTPAQYDLLTLKDTHAVDRSKKVVLCIDSQYGNILSESRAFSPKLEKELAKLGPVRRPELEFLFLEASLAEILDHPQLEILLEEGLLEHDVGWKKILSKYQTHFTKHRLVPLESKADFSFFKSEEIAHEAKFISASRLQDFLDCPKKYHASRISKITPLVKQVSEVDVMNLGNIEHELIKIGWEHGEQWWREIANLESEARRLLIHRFGFSDLSPITVAGAAHEASLYSLNGLMKLKVITDQLPGARVEFAVELDRSGGRQGEIDCLVRSDNLELILDFKRSRGQNPSLGQFKSSYSKIQLWFYLNSRQISQSKEYGVGYLFLKDIEDSWILTSAQVRDLLEPSFPKRVDAWDDFDSDLKAYREFEDEALERWRREVDFLPLPSSKKICSFCDLSAVCTKASLDEEEDE